MKTQSEIAEQIAKQAHEGQFRRDGKTPYWTHPGTVAMNLEKDGHDDETVAAGWLHDVLEDCPAWNVMRLMEHGVSKRVAAAVVDLTKDRQQDYQDYLRQVKANRVAREVKVQDIRHNLCSNPKPENVAKYANALVFLLT